MMQLGTQRIGADGHLMLGGCDAVELAAQYGTPLYVLDEALVRQNCAAYRDALATAAPSSQVMFASKALLCSAVARLVASEGLGVDVASGGELHTALKAGLDGRQLLLHGNFKSADEMRLALTNHVGRLVVDSLDELDAWSAMAGELGIGAPVMIRVNPNVKPKTHTKISVGQIDSKFGLSIQAGHAMQAVKRALELPNLELLGPHYHIGSQVLGHQAFAAAAGEMAEFLAAVKQSTGYEAREVNLGGGLGIRYLAEHEPPAIADFVHAIVPSLLATLAEHGLAVPKVLLEPGRSITGEAGLTLYRIGPVKTIPDIRTYVSVDGGLSDNPRPEMYGAEYEVFLANRAADEADQVVTVAGKHCETDTLFRDVKLPLPQTGELLAVQSTGAYNYAMASNYNRLPRPAMVLVNDGRADLIVRRETYDDLVKCDLMPVRLANA